MKTRELLTARGRLWLLARDGSSATEKPVLVCELMMT
jgi:hypothetical protein